MHTPLTIEQLLAFLAALLVGSSVNSFVSALRASSHARNGSAQAQNLSLTAIHDLFNDCLTHRAIDRQRIDVLEGALSRAANMLREAAGRHRIDHEGQGGNCPYYERYQMLIDRVIIGLEEAIERA